MINLTQIRQAIEAERDKHVAICEACLAAGRPDLMAGFIASGKTAHAVQAELAQLPAAEPVKKPAGNGGAFDVAAVEAAARAAGRVH